MEKTAIEDVFQRLGPERCVFVISVDENGKPNGMIAAWNMRCSADPPLFAVSLSKEGYTHQLIRQSREFVIAVANKEVLEALRLFGSTHGDRIDKFAESRVETVKAECVKPPLLKNATINLECKLVSEVDSGDHIIFIGKIVVSHLNQDKKALMLMNRPGKEGVFEEF